MRPLAQAVCVHCDPLNVNAQRIELALAPLKAGAKRSASRDAIQGWYPYYAGYSLDFAETVLRAMALPSGARVLDPWNGSGTTSFAAARLGLTGWGIDMNPVAITVARARLAHAADANGVRGFLRNTLRKRDLRGTFSRGDPLREWLPKATVAEFRALQGEIVANFAAPECGAPLWTTNDDFPPLASFLLLALVRAAKSRVAARAMSNPTLFRPKTRNPSRSASGNLLDDWLSSLTAMAQSLASATWTTKDWRIVLGDARCLPVPAKSIDFVLTSPPYCTRLDYIDTTRFELAALTPLTSTALLSLRRGLMGAPLVREREKPDPPDTWPDSVRNLLVKIRRHPSKASDSYYYKTYLQYFTDASTSLSQIARSMKTSSGAALVVQSSYYKDVRVDLPSLYTDLARSCGLRSTIAHDMSVRTVLASINPGTRNYRRNWDYRESVVFMWKD